MPTIRRLSASQVSAAGRTLARAFQDDPFTVYMIPDAAERARLLPAHFTPYVRWAQRVGEVLATPGVDAVAVWVPSHVTDIAPADATESGLEEVESIVGRAAMARFGVVMARLDRVQRRTVPGPYWFLPLLGVDPSRQGQGLGSALLEPIVTRARTARLPCRLDTLQPRNVVFYRRNGFSAVEEDVEPVSGLRYWAFVREPR